MLRKELVIGFVVAGFLAALVPERLLAVAVPDRPRLLVHPGERRARAVPGDHQLRLLGRQRSAGGRAVAGRHQLRRRHVLRLRRPDHAAAAVDLPQVLRHRHHAAPAGSLLGHHERRGAGGGVPVPALAHRRPGTGRRWSCTPAFSGTTPASSTSSRWSLSPASTGCTATATPAGAQRYAKDPVCGMQVEKAHAPATAPSPAQQRTGSAATTARTASRRCAEAVPAAQRRQASADQHAPTHARRGPAIDRKGCTGDRHRPRPPDRPASGSRTPAAGCPMPRTRRG